MFCVVLFHRTHNVVFFLGKRKINFKHLMARGVDVGANSPWGETGNYLHKITQLMERNVTSRERE